MQLMFLPPLLVYLCDTGTFPVLALYVFFVDFKHNAICKVFNNLVEFGIFIVIGGTNGVLVIGVAFPFLILTGIY